MVTWRHTLTPSTQSLSFSSECRRVRIKRGFVFLPAERNAFFQLWGMYISIRLWETVQGCDGRFKLINSLRWTDWFISVESSRRGCKVFSSNPQTSPVSDQTHPGGNGPSARFFASHLLFWVSASKTPTGLHDVAFTAGLRELGFSVLDLQDTASLKPTQCPTWRKADLSDKFCFLFKLIRTKYPKSAMILTTFVIILSFPGKCRTNLFLWGLSYSICQFVFYTESHAVIILSRGSALTDVHVFDVLPLLRRHYGHARSLSNAQASICFIWHTKWTKPVIGKACCVQNNVYNTQIFPDSLLVTPRLRVHLEGWQQLSLPAGASGLRKGQWTMSKGVLLQHQVPDDEAVCGGQREQLQCGHGSRGAGRVSQRYRRHEAESSVQLQVQKRHEEGEELSPDLLEHISELAGYALSHS